MIAKADSVVFFHSQYRYYLPVVNKPMQVLCVYKTPKVEILSLVCLHEEGHSYSYIHIFVCL